MISVPFLPIVKQTSEIEKEGTSFVPSPVTATILPWAFKDFTNLYFYSGLHLATILY